MSVVLPEEQSFPVFTAPRLLTPPPPDGESTLPRRQQPERG
jgi:hypothetical protein